MKNLFAFCLLTLSLVSLVGCGTSIVINGNSFQFDFQGEKAERTESGEVPDSVRRIEIENQFGDVRVEASVEGKWNWAVTCWSDSPEAAELYTEEVQMHVDTRGEVQTWRIELPQGADDLRGLKSNLTINLPASVEVVSRNSHGGTTVDNRDASVDTENSHGDTHLKNLTEDCNAVNHHGHLVASRVMGGKYLVSHGNLQVDQVAGQAKLNCSHGDLKLESIAGFAQVCNSHGKTHVVGLRDGGDVDCQQGSIVIENSMGNLSVKGAHSNIDISAAAGEIETRTEHGYIRIKSEAESVVCNNEHGDIVLTLSNPDLRKVFAKTGHAKIRVEMPAQVEANFSTNVEHGDIQNEFESSSNGINVTLKNQHGDIVVKKAN